MTNNQRASIHPKQLRLRPHDAMFSKFLVQVSIVVFAVPGYAQLCPPSDAAGLDGIGDGCTTVNLEYAFPHVGAFRGLFTPACDAHDKCYTQLGADYDGCDASFYERLRERCDDKYNRYLRTAEWAACRQTAFEYYTAVKGWRAFYNGALEDNFQGDALARSLWQQHYVETDTCATTPERSTLYAPNLIEQVNTAFLTQAGRLPTVYEFMAVVNSADISHDRSGWNAVLQAQAGRAAVMHPPPVSWNSRSPDGVEYILSTAPGSADVAYEWHLSPQGSGTGPTTILQFEEPQYNRAAVIRGYLKATSAAGVRNLVLIEQRVTLRGWCGVSGGRNVHCQ
jgi:hypothetical protein